MIARAVVSGLVALIIAASAVAMWRYLNANEVEHFARVAEAESYAARSRLIRDLEMQIRALRDVAEFWELYGRTPREQWDMDAQVEPSHFAGIRRIVWSDPASDVRYATTPEKMALDHRPSDLEWETLREILTGVDPAGGKTMLGPVLGDDGHYLYRVVMPSRRRGSRGVLVAVVDAHDTLEQFLVDRSPGYAISVYWGDYPLYERDVPAADLPDTWTREGLIELSTGPLWRIVHQPTDQLAGSVARPALDGLLAAGWVIAALAGFLTYQNGKVGERARAAERAEHELAALNRDLEAQVRERTSELAQQTTDLETLSESVSHDLRNPLNTVGLNVHLLREMLARDDLSRATDAIGHIDHAKAQMIQILGRLRSFSQVSFATFARERVDMARLVREVFDELNYSEPPPPVELVLTDLRPCRADPTLARILVLNLLGNALKYTRGREPRRVEVGCQDRVEPVGYYVKDNGIGFDPARAEELFEPFKRAVDGDRTDGQGIGLAIAARVVHRHGGRIRAEGAPGEGAIFYFGLGDARVVET